MGRRKNMTFGIRTRVGLACLSLLIAGSFHVIFAQTGTAGPHLWDKPLDPAILEKRVNEQLDLAQKSINELLATKERRTIENTLAPFDNAAEKLDTAGDQSGVMQLLSPDAGIRDRAQAMVQKVSAASTALSLNPAIYHALADLDVSKADAATQYYVKRTLLEFRLAGVDKDDATRARIQALDAEVAN